MKLTHNDITKIWNQAILNETGFEGNVEGLFDYEDYTVEYFSKDDRTVITLHEVDFLYEPELTTARFVNTNSENPSWNYAY